MIRTELLAAVFQDTHVAIAIARLADGCLVEANPAFEKLFGYSADEMRGKSFVQLGLGGPAEYEPLIEELRGSGRLKTLQSPLVGKRGEQGLVQATLHVVGSGTDAYLVGMFADIDRIANLKDTMREREALKGKAERVLALSEATYRAAVETCGDGFCMFDDQGRLLVVNEAFVRESGYSREELLSMSIADLEISESRDDIREHTARVKAKGTDSFVTWHRTKEGLPWRVEVIVAYWPSAGGRYFAFLRDVSERQRASDALKESEARFRSTFEQVAVGMAHVALDGGWLRINRKLCDIVGYSEAELRAIKAQDITHPDDFREGLDFATRMLAGEISTCSTEKRYFHKSGRIVWANVTTTLSRDDTGAPVYFISVVEDISERKNIAVELASLRRKLETMTKFDVAGHTVAALAHELNQPLNAVSSYAEAALRLLRAGNPQPDKLKRAIEKSAQQAQRAGRVVHNLLAFLKHGEVQREAVNLNDVARRVIRQIKANSNEGIRFNLDLAGDFPPVKANRLQVKKVLTNLIENGIEAMHYAGSPQTAITVTVRTNNESSQAQVSVIDTGPGIDAAILHRIFDAFFTTKPNGLGVGLSISRTIIESHGGELWAESLPGAGASFHFTLPIASS